MAKTFSGSRGPDANRFDLIPEPKRSKVAEICRITCRTAQRERGLAYDPCVDRNHACYRCQDLADAALSQEGE